MDESVENMDNDNFIDVLPKLMEFIVSEYRHVLLISQRDVRHLECNELMIKNGVIYEN